MSPILFAALLVLSATQVLCDDDKARHDEIMDALTSVNRTVNQMFEMMLTQKDRDIESVNKKVEGLFEQLRTKREAPAENSEAIEKIQNAFKGFQEGFSTFVKNVTSSDLYKNVQKIGEDLQNKGKELGEKLKETIENARKENSDEKKD